MLPDALRGIIARVRARLRAVAIAHGVIAAGAVFAVLLVAGAPLLTALVVAGMVVTAIVAMRWRIDDVTTARFVEARQPLDNLLVTAAELAAKPRPVEPEIRDAVLHQASERIASIHPARLVPLLHATGAAVAVVLGCVLLASLGNVGERLQERFADAARAANGTADILVRVTPPAYTRQAAETHQNPTQISVVAGSQLRIESDGRVLREWAAKDSEALEVRVADDGPSRFLSVIVVPDAAPSVRITEPGRDTAFAGPTGALRIGVESRDDFGLATLALRYTKASGGGENVTFTEGEVPLAIDRVDGRQWRGRAEWTIDGLDLADGDVLVYRAVARDTNPDGAAVESDAFLVEIGKASEIASAGFALPTEEKKYAISQQMVIYKTEQLLANRAKHAHDWLEQTRMLGVEQRMVRAEVVFLSGGEVQDEVEEAAHSHELAEGRLENQGRAEMVRALNFMSRAEAQLNDGNAEEALLFERQALASLERALDRRRYFLRTLPDRSRIDLSRRLTGERAEARSWTRERANTEPVLDERARELMRELTAASAGSRDVDASLAAKVAAIDPNSPDLQNAAVSLASARSDDERRKAVSGAMAAVIEHALSAIPGASPVYIDHDPLAGKLADEIRARPRR